MRVPPVPLWSLLVLVATLLWAPAAGAQTQSPACPALTPACVLPESTPTVVSVRTDTSITYVRYDTRIRNAGRSTMTQVSVVDTLPAGTENPVFETSQGTCSPSEAAGRPVVTCDVGSLASGAEVEISVSVRGPEAAGRAENSVVTSFAAGDNSGTDPKRTVTATASTEVLRADAGRAESWVPPGTQTTISTDPTGSGIENQQPQIASLQLTAPAQGALAALKPSDRPVECGKREVCRGGTWTEGQALIDGQAANFAEPLVFTLRWNKTLVSRKQTERNFTLFYAKTANSPVITISRRCPDGDPTVFEDGCLQRVTQEADGDFTAVFVQHHNGYMR